MLIADQESTADLQEAVMYAGDGKKEWQMININDPKVQEVCQGIHEAMLRKVEKGRRINEEIVLENRMIAVLCADSYMHPTDVAGCMNERYGYELTGDDVLRIFRSSRMANPNERKELFRWAERVAELFSEAIGGEKELFDRYESARRKPAIKGTRKHNFQERIAAIMIYTKYPEIDAFEDTSSLYLLGNTLARYFFYDISDAVCEVYGFPLFRENRKEQHFKETKKKLSYEQALRRIEQLENTLERTNTMLQELQDEFEEQLEASKVKELADFFAKLNSEKYGCILDELLVVRKGVDELKKRNYELPIEINGLLIMVRKLIQFVRDSHIEPVMKMNSTREVLASDVEFCNYEGTPFITPEEKKTVRVVSSGWIYKDKELQISRPKVKEET